MLILRSQVNADKFIGHFLLVSKVLTRGNKYKAGFYFKINYHSNIIENYACRKFRYLICRSFCPKYYNYTITQKHTQSPFIHHLVRFRPSSSGKCNLREMRLSLYLFITNCICEFQKLNIHAQSISTSIIYYCSTIIIPVNLCPVTVMTTLEYLFSYILINLVRLLQKKGEKI